MLLPEEITHILETQEALCNLGSGENDDGSCPICRSIKAKLESFKPTEAVPEDVREEIKLIIKAHQFGSTPDEAMDDNDRKCMETQTKQIYTKVFQPLLEKAKSEAYDIGYKKAVEQLGGEIEKARERMKMELETFDVGEGVTLLDVVCGNEWDKFWQSLDENGIDDRDLCKKCEDRMSQEDLGKEIDILKQLTEVKGNMVMLDKRLDDRESDLINAKQEERERIISELGAYENDLGFVEISNHVPWQSLSKKEGEG